MKRLLLTATIAFHLVCCTELPKAHITFCEQPNIEGHCTGEQSEFTLSEVFLTCESASQFKTELLVGNIYKITEEGVVLVGTRKFTLDPSETKISYSIPFYDFGPEGTGTFKIEFVSNEGNTLASEQLTITPLTP